MSQGAHVQHNMKSQILAGVRLDPRVKINLTS